MKVACDNVPYAFVVVRGLQRGGAISAEATLRKRVPVDMAVCGVHIQALTAAGPTLSLSLNIRPTRDGQSLVFTKEGPLVPAALWMGTNGAPFRWRAPRIWRKNDQIEVTVEPTDGVTICQLTITFFGERIVSKNSALWAWDRQDLGYAAVAFEMLSCPQPGVSCEPGDSRRSVLNMGGWSYDLCLDEISALVVDPDTDPNLPITGQSGEFQLFAAHAEQWLSDEFMPLSFCGGQTQDGSQPETYRPVAASLGGGLVVPSNGHIELSARALRGATDPLGVWVMLHGQRKPAATLRRGVDGC